MSGARREPALDQLEAAREVHEVHVWAGLQAVAIGLLQGRAGEDAGAGGGAQLVDLGAQRIEPGGAVGVGEAFAAAHLFLVRLRVEVVGVEEGPALRGRERLSDRGLAGARHAHQDDDHARPESLTPPRLITSRGAGWGYRVRFEAALLFLLTSAGSTIGAGGSARAEEPAFLPFTWDAKKGRAFLEVSPGQELLYGVGLAGGAGVLEVSLDRGQLGDLGLVRFVRVGPRVLLDQRQTVHRSGVADRERTRVVEESFPSSVLAAFEIAAETASRVLVDATDFLLRDTVVLPALRQAKLGDWRQDAARSVLHLDRTGAFPRNTEIEALLTFTSDSPPRRPSRRCCPTAAA